MNALHSPGDAAWRQIAPILDEAIDELGVDDRKAIILRFFEGHDLRTVGAALGATDDAAQKRVSRAVDKLRESLTRRGVTLTVAALATALASRAVMAAPAGLATTVGSAALLAGASGVGLAAGALKLLAPLSIKLAVGAIAVAALVTPFILHNRHGGDVGNTNAGTNLPTSVQVVPDATAGSRSTASTNTSLADSSASSTASNVLHLTVLAADNGGPVPNARIDYHRNEGRKIVVNTLSTSQTGNCDVAVPRATTTKLELTTRIDGFADTRLHWDVELGEIIPTNHVLRLARAVPIGGWVADADGRPVAGAKVGVYHAPDPTMASQPEDYQVLWTPVSTDADGHWVIDRVAPELIHRLSVTARHPDHVDAPYLQLDRDPEAEKQLRALSYVSQLGRAISLRGIVVGPDGQPVPDAKVFVGFRHLANLREATSAADGTFVVNGCKPGEAPVSAEAAGFATITMETDITTNSEPVRLTLHRGKVVSLHVVDKTGQGVAHAHVQQQMFSPGADLLTSGSSNPPPSQAEFKADTDSEGRLVWSNAPDAEMTFTVTAPGHMPINSGRVNLDDQEHLITLPPSLVVTGTVRDAASGQPIPRFRIIVGSPDPLHPNDPTRAHWSPFEHPQLNVSRGEFRHAFGETMVMGTTNLGYVVKFEADGYAPFTSRVIHPDEGEAQLDVQLHVAGAVNVAVLLPDGRPAAGADVGLVSPGARLLLLPGGLSRQHIESTEALLVTDAAGHFNLPDDNTITRVIVACADGYAEVKPSDLAGQPTIRLQRWGRVEGTYLAGGHVVLFVYGGGDPDTISADFMGFRAKTDANGQFVFPQVPPGKHSLSCAIPWPPPHENSFNIEELGGVEIRPGETTTVNLGSGYAVSARLRWGDGVAPETNRNILAIVHTPYPAEIEHGPKDPATAAKLVHSPEFLEFRRAARSVQAVVSSDDIVTADNVLSGDYVLDIFVMPEPRQV